ncbi:MAG: hypothetical protein FJZ58_01045 [Chlamydiae bacterium]|nr:hypothetical protein [Chlamydiota bacterium]
MHRKDDFDWGEKDVSYAVNYIYYGLYFLVLSWLQVFHVLLIDKATALVQGGYALYAVGETFVETVILALTAGWLLHKKKTKWYICWTLLSLVLLLLHGIDFPLERLMDLSVWFGLSFAIREALTSFVEVLRASTIPLSHWLLAAGGALLFFFIGFLLVRLSEKICQKKPWSWSLKKAFGYCVMGGVLLVSCEVLLFFTADTNIPRLYNKAMPWKRTLLPTEEFIWTVGSCLKKEFGAHDCLQDVDSNSFSLERKPDIFLFITESLRKDYLTEEVAPHLHTFAKSYASFPRMLSVANATHISWFSTFYSLFPFYWTDYQPGKWTSGSHALGWLKKMGYSTHVYSATRLGFYSMREVLFGEGDHVVDEVLDVQAKDQIPPHQADTIVIQTLCDKLQTEKKGGRLFILFLDSTHFDYSWPQQEATVFTPIEEEVSYIKLSYSRKDMHKITNRYKNAIHHVDALFHKFTTFLQRQGGWEDAVIVLTGDHAESFNEDGHMFHASALSLPQLSVPMYMKLGTQTALLETTQATSQMDIFPTLFHHLLGEDSLQGHFQGKSLLVPREHSYTLSARYNAGEAPFQFCLHNGQYRAVLEFCNPLDIFHCHHLKVCAMEDLEGREVPFSLSFVQKQFQQALETLFTSYESH